ncbi:hypothetical protein BGX20_003024, partial [Mortierella sp. AD010]
MKQSQSNSDNTSCSIGVSSNLGEVHSALQAYYEPLLAIQRVSEDIINLDSCYINLAIVEALDQKQKEKEELLAQAMAFQRMPSYEEIIATNMREPIRLEDLFNKRELRDGKEDAPKTILIHGRAGIGKTTLCKKLVHTYLNGLWKDRFEAVIWLPLRHLRILKVNNLEDLLRQKYFSLHLDEKKAALASILAARARNGKVLFVLDGLDEVVTDIQTDDGDPTGMFLKHLLQQTHVIITSRPSGVDTSILPKLDLELETIGFSQENVKNYLANVLKPEAARDIQDFIQRTPLLQGLVNIPVQLDVICYSWDSLPSNEHSLTMTGLYQTMVGKLWRKDGIRLQKSTDGEKLTFPQISRLRSYQIDSLMANEIEYLSYLAFVGMRENHQIEFNEAALLDAIEELDQHREKSNKCPLPFHLLDKLKQTSFLHTADGGVDAGNNTFQHSWHFLHLTFQEYFAAIWLAQHLRSEHSNSIGCSTLTMTVGETKAFIAKHKYNPRYEIIWWMVSGQLEGETLGLFLDLLQETPRDLIGGQHQRLLAGCLREARSKLNDEVIAGLETELMQWLHFERILYSNDGAESTLGRQSVFPEELLVRCLSQTKASQKYAFKALKDRSIASESTIVALIDALEDHDSYT